MNSENLLIKALLATALMLPAAGFGAVSIEPGQWDMTVSVSIPMLPAPQEQTSSECIEESEINPEDFSMDDTGGCSLSNVSESGNSISWDISCQTPAGPAQGQMKFSSGGDTMSGEGNMVMSVNGQEIELKTSWQGQRTGDCSE